MAHSSSRRTSTPRASNQAMSSGTKVAARSLRGFAMRPTALSFGLGIKEKLAIAFCSLNRTLNDSGAEPKSLDAGLDAVARLTMLDRIAHDAALAHLALANLKLRLDQDHHFRALRQERGNRGNQQRRRNKAGVAHGEIERLG